MSLATSRLTWDDREGLCLQVTLSLENDFVLEPWREACAELTSCQPLVVHPLVTDGKLDLSLSTFVDDTSKSCIVHIGETRTRDTTATDARFTMAPAKVDMQQNRDKKRHCYACMARKVIIA